MTDYTHPTTKYNENGILEELYCKCCGTLIGKMDEIPSKKYPEKIKTLDDGRIIIERFTERSFNFNASYRLIFVTMIDGSYATIPVCIECENKEHDLIKLSNIIMDEFEEDMIKMRRPQIEIDLHKKIWKKNKIITKHIKNSKDLEEIQNKLNLNKIGRIR